MRIVTITLESPLVAVSTTKVNVQKFYYLLTKTIFVLSMDLNRNSVYFPIQH